MTTRLRTKAANSYLSVRGKAAPARLENVSSEGACLADAPYVVVGEGVGYSIADGKVIQARVVWKDGNKIGVRNIKPDLQTFANSAIARRQARMPAVKDVELLLRGKRVKSSLRDISRKGACVLSLGALQKGETIALCIDGSICVDAMVRWVEHGRAGLRFEKDVPLARLTCNTVPQMASRAEKRTRYLPA